MTAPAPEAYATFESTGLPQHPAVMQAFAELKRIDTQDQCTTRGVKIAHIVATESAAKDPEAIAAALLVPLASDNGAVLLAHAALPGRVPEIIESLFAFGALTLNDAQNGKEVEDFYKSLDPAARSVILASSARMFDAIAQDMSTVAPKDAQMAAYYLSRTLQNLRDFTTMVARAETDEKALVAKCQESLQNIEDAVAQSSAPAATAPHKKTTPFKP